MKNIRLYTLFFGPFFFILTFYGCTEYQSCYEKETDPIIIDKESMNVNYVAHWEIIPVSKLHKIVFRFSERPVYQDNQIEVTEVLRKEDVCTLSSFNASLGIWADSSIDPTFYTRIVSRKLLAWYPSVPPSGKVLQVEGNKNNGVSLQMRLPSADKQIPNQSWIELGFELIFKSEFNNGLTEDIELLKNEVEYFKFEIDYTKF